MCCCSFFRGSNTLKRMTHHMFVLGVVAVVAVVAAAAQQADMLMEGCEDLTCSELCFPQKYPQNVCLNSTTDPLNIFNNEELNCVPKGGKYAGAICAEITLFATDPSCSVGNATVKVARGCGLGWCDNENSYIASCNHARQTVVLLSNCTGAEDARDCSSRCSKKDTLIGNKCRQINYNGGMQYAQLQRIFQCDGNLVEIQAFEEGTCASYVSSDVAVVGSCNRGRKFVCPS